MKLFDRIRRARNDYDPAHVAELTTALHTAGLLPDPAHVAGLTIWRDTPTTMLARIQTEPGPDIAAVLDQFGIRLHVGGRVEIDGIQTALGNRPQP